MTLEWWPPVISRHDERVRYLEWVEEEEKKKDEEKEKEGEGDSQNT
jgi:hypothetical protein